MSTSTINNVQCSDGSLFIEISHSTIQFATVFDPKNGKQLFKKKEINFKMLI